MKHAAVAIVLVVLLIPNAGALNRPGDVRITSKALYSRATSAGTVTVYLLYNRALTPHPIGNAQLLCVDLGAEVGPLPRQAKYCFGNYAIGRSTLNVHGVARRSLYFQLAVVGGTGVYNNVGGTATIIRYASRPIRERLVFQLTT